MKAKIENRKIIFKDEFESGKLIEQHEGKDVLIEIRRDVKRRSNNQNSYYWGVVIPSYQLGFQKHCVDLLDSNLSKEVTDFILSNMYVVSEQAHEALKTEYANEMKDETGIDSELSTKNMTTLEYENYLEFCRMFIGAKFGIQVSLPNE